MKTLQKSLRYNLDSTSVLLSKPLSYSRTTDKCINKTLDNCLL